MSPRTLTHGEVVDLLSQLKEKGVDVEAFPDHGSSHNPPLQTDAPEYWQISVDNCLDYTLFNGIKTLRNPNGDIWYNRNYVSKEVSKQHSELVESALESIVEKAQAEQPSPQKP